MKPLAITGFVFAMLLAVLLRCPELTNRPMHNDEAVNAIKVGQLWNEGVYRYDSNEYHGPTLIYATRAAMAIFGIANFASVTESNLRMVTVGFGLGIILLLLLLKKELGVRSLIFTAALTAVSPAFVFYSRYFIHEMLLVFFTLAALGCLWRYLERRTLIWAMAFGLAVGLMQATKETFVFALAAMVIAAVLANHRQFFASEKNRNLWLDKKNITHLSAGLLCWAFIIITLFSSFFTNWVGIADAFRTYLPWIHRAGGESPHVQPWHFYFVRLLGFHHGRGPFWSEGFIFVLAIIGMVAALRELKDNHRGNFKRFLVFYTLSLTLIYTVISYKTPWCLLGFWHGFILLAAVGADALLRWMPNPPIKIGLGFILLAGFVQLGWQSWQQDTTYAADPRNPYVYAQTSPDILNLVERVNLIALTNKKPTVIAVVATDDDYWPLPWYLRQFNEIGWYHQLSPQIATADLIIASPSFSSSLATNSNQLMTGFYALRPRVFLQLYARTNVWNDYLHRPQTAIPRADQ